ncbi:MAG: hypothetical protein MZV63_08190 [Marinilabiliales bacterium]|nr:hypothetical protein [Marinilabiliales bacterium]
MPRGQGDRSITRQAEWHDVWFAGETRPSGNQGYVKFISARKESLSRNIMFILHWRVLEDGKYNTLDLRL